MAKSGQSRPTAGRTRRWLQRVWPDPAADGRRVVAQRLYQDLVKQARLPVLYREFGVPDTPEGRFEMIALHAALVVRRLRAAGAPGGALAQELFDLMFADLDESLRHIGVGDLSVGKQIRRLAGQFYARLQALDQALATEPATPLVPMLRTNVYHGGAAPGPQQLEALASYLAAADAALRTQPSCDLLDGRVEWVAPDAPHSVSHDESTGGS